MRRALGIVAGVIAVAAGVALYSQGNAVPTPARMSGGISFRIRLGVQDKSPTSWDGSIAVSLGAISSIRGWRFGTQDSIDSPSSWKCSTRLVSMVWLGKSGPVGNSGPVLENGIIVTASADQPDTRFEVKTGQGAFPFAAADIPWATEKAFLEGRVLIDRVPPVTRLTASAEEQDFPAIAQDGDSVYVSYVEFVRGDRDRNAQELLPVPLKNFEDLAAAAAGDQVFLMRFSKARREWGSPIAVSAPKQDVVRTAVAVDGQKRVWVFWSARQNGNFDIRAKSLSDGRWSAEMSVSSDPGTDLNPVAATDSAGRVWVAWQGFRNNNLEILAAAQSGDGFSAESVVSFSPQSDWDPSIAAASNGEVSIAWDTYDKGDYDVYFRRVRMANAIELGPPVPIATSPNFEARSSIAYDSQNRLWATYEVAGSKWGKDFGAHETSGTALYQDHTVAVKCFQGAEVLAPEADLAKVLTGRKELFQPDPQLAPQRKPNDYSANPLMRANSYPRIATTPGGAIFLTYRTPMGRGWFGGNWIQKALYLDGGVWKGPVTIPNTDYFLDGRPAIAALGPEDLLMVAASDRRFTASKSAPGDTDLSAAEFRLGSVAAARVRPAPAEKALSGADPESNREREQVRRIRDFRVAAAGGKLQLLRGEFHRHTEVSGDGGRDGSLIDAYRYLIDAADMDWAGCCDHDNGGREYSWWLTQKLTDAYDLGSRYVSMFSYERSRVYPEGHRNVVFAQRGIRPLPKLPTMAENSKPEPAPDTKMLYRYLKRFNGIVASHTSGTSMGTDWRDNDPLVEPAVEIYQGDRQNYEMPAAPRTNSAEDSIGGWRPLGFVSAALQKGYRLGFLASSDHTSTHMSYCNLWVASPTREGIMEAFRKRRVYGSTDDILAVVRSGDHFMGEEFTTSEPPAISVQLQGKAPFAKVHIIKDSKYVYSIEPGKKDVDFAWKDSAPVKGITSYYYVRGEQADGELVWVSPMWITYR